MTNFFHSKIHRVVVLSLLLVWAMPVQSMDRVYQSPEDFIAGVFPARPQPRLLWLSREIQAEISRILGHAPGQLRQRYWSEGSRTLWILEETGKEDLITAGFVIREGRMEQAKVLVYRESRGMEVRYPAFLNQLKGMFLMADNRLDHAIDGISGATLSVQAMQRMARAALYFDSLARESQRTENQSMENQNAENQNPNNKGSAR